MFIPGALPLSSYQILWEQFFFLIGKYYSKDNYNIYHKYDMGWWHLKFSLK